MEQSITVQSLSSLTNICQISVIWKASCHSFSSLVEKEPEIMLALILQLCSSSTQALVFTSVHVNLPVIQVSSPVTAEPDVPSKNCWCTTTRNHNAFSSNLLNNTWTLYLFYFVFPGSKKHSTSENLLLNWNVSCFKKIL
jgi:hypothetical protein